MMYVAFSLWLLVSYVYFVREIENDIGCLLLYFLFKYAFLIFFFMGSFFFQYCFLFCFMYLFLVDSILFCSWDAVVVLRFWIVIGLWGWCIAIFLF